MQAGYFPTGEHFWKDFRHWQFRKSILSSSIMNKPTLTLITSVLLACAGSLSAQEDAPAMKGARADDSGHLHIPLQVTSNIRAVYQVSDDKLSDGVAKALAYAKKLIDVYNKNGIKDDEIDLHLVFHGQATNALVNNATRKRLKADGGAENPNRELLAELLKRAVHIELCQSSMEQRNVVSKDLLKGVATVPGAFPRLIELQLLGYPYIKFE